MEEKFSTEPEGHDAHSFISYVLHGFTFLFREHVPGQQVREWVMDLVEIMKENPFQKDTFLYYIDKILVNYSHYSKDYSVWHEALNILTTGMELYHIEFRCSHSILSALIFATALVHDIRLKGEKVHEFAVSDAHLRLRRIASNLLLLFDVDSLAEEMYSALPALSMDTALIGLYHKPVRNGDKFADRSIDTLIGFDRQQKFNMKYNSWNRINFSDYSTIDGFDFERERRTLFFLPLFFKDDEAGVALLRYDADNTVDAYETIRINISTAVKGAELISKIHTLSITDELTGLLNRRGFFQFVYSRLQHLNRNDELKAIVMFMDMDGLKYINDTYGHTEGDTAISAFAKTLRDALREEDIIGRVGGDEFVVFSSVKSEKNGKQVIARIREKIEEYNTRELHPYRVAASIGSVVLEGNTKEFFEAAMLSADSILYEEKIEKKKQGLSRN
jgi:diguanylate cyclase (GGDEF)-like protein